ncbi:hypothetical protein ABH941_003525 [Streptacidiphilus sp. EB103A]
MLTLHQTAHFQCLVHADHHGRERVPREDWPEWGKGQI